MEVVCGTRLFQNDIDSPAEEAMATRVTSPIVKGDKSFLLTDDSGLGMECDQPEPIMFSLPSCVDFNNVLDDSFSAFQIRGRKKSRRSLFTNKRSADTDDIEEYSPNTKKVCDEENCLVFPSVGVMTPPASTDAQDTRIINAVDRLTLEADLVADGSRDHTLPTIPSKHSDLKAISPETMADVVRGCYDDNFTKATILDCRYPYEYDGGHIQGAVNMYTKEAIHQFLLENSLTSSHHVLIFHCEFSSERGPKMYRFLRSLDRDMNKDHYPRLHFPEIYLIEGGYKVFYHQHKDLCSPMSYKPMLHEDHTADLRHFRVKSKSWTAGEKGQGQGKRRSRTRVTIPF